MTPTPRTDAAEQTGAANYGNLLRLSREFETEVYSQSQLLSGALESLTLSRAIIETLQDELTAALSANEETRRNRCEHCGAKLYSGPPDCPVCGAPNCCQQCCKIEELQKQGAEMREVLEYMNQSGGHGLREHDMMEKALSSDCGTGFVRKEEVERAEAKVAELKAARANWKKVANDRGAQNDLLMVENCELKAKAAKKALTSKQEPVTSGHGQHLHPRSPSSQPDAALQEFTARGKSAVGDA